MQVFAKNIEWDTDDFDETDAIAMGTDEPLWELPSEVELDPSENLSEESVEKFLEQTYGFSVIDFRLVVVSDEESP